MSSTAIPTIEYCYHDSKVFTCFFIFLIIGFLLLYIASYLQYEISDDIYLILFYIGLVITIICNIVLFSLFIKSINSGIDNCNNLIIYFFISFSIIWIIFIQCLCHSYEYMY